MGSKITKAIYKNQRSKPVPLESIRSAVGLLSLVLYSISTILIGYVFDIDIILEQPTKIYYQISNPKDLNQIQNSFIIFFIFALSVSCALFSHRFIQLKCSVLCIVSQTILYLSLYLKSLVLMKVGEVLLEISYVGLIISALCYLNHNFKVSANFVFALFFSLHQIGIKVSSLITPNVHLNSFSAVYTLSILFVFLQLLCMCLVFILEKTYLMKKERRVVSVMQMVENAEIMIQQSPTYKKYIPLFLLIGINQFCANRLSKQQGNQNEKPNIVYLMIGSIIIVGVCYVVKYIQRNSYKLVLNQILQFTFLFFAFRTEQVGRTLYVIFLSSYNTGLLIFLPNNYFNLAVGIFVVFPSYLGRIFLDDGVVNILVCLTTFQILNFISYFYWKKHKSTSSLDI